MGTATILSPKPFLKWAGGKSQLLSQMAPYLPHQCRCYAEPFCGSAALYWYLFGQAQQGQFQFQQARLSDRNPELMNCYQIVRDRVEDLIQELTAYRQQHSEAFYYHIRSLDQQQLDPLARAARFIYLNKTCFNGLYRVNRAGQFNVPMGRYRNPQIFDPEALRQASIALQNVTLSVADFQEVLTWATAGDFIYFDPPYYPLSKTASFTSYTDQPFGEAEQIALAKVVGELAQRGCYVMLSNAWVEPMLQLYQSWRCIELKASRVINSNHHKRGKISELLVVTYGHFERE
ncbi:DNA adenine methylase [Thermosynechococcus sp. B0]|uniref:DNA adenine methylase n=2 Tax=unclassified Thermosynechococcus TaxID=2622553 RepID=UPI00122DD32B|nr:MULTISPECIES: DNA adenine methylase [unclassified Thermosynechococcus]QEQ01692.1 DNA adenine methylase [Thermosynechococcus sp. CL-1]WJI23564.1 DNA adenine methylase [Thermosynechococcus sp. B0]WJI26077.1 DNA adenine methylase [Thermosynechococcus sp. B1]WJI28606.1 DNA adenine methylase [Thermosynechococcus sp. B3]WNC64876.1 DNA adenine methylase [Thermosynechococcus sp. HY593]